MKDKHCHFGFRGIRWGWLALSLGMLLNLGLGTSPSSAAAPIVDVVEIPAALLARFEPEVRAQLQEQRTLLQGLLADPAANSQERAEAYGQLGRLYHFYDLVEAATQCFAAAQAHAPTDYRWSYYLGTLYENSGRFTEAIASYEASLQHERQLATLMRLGDLWLKLDQLTQAADFYQQALAVRPQAGAALYGLGQIALRQRDFAAAIRFFTATLAEQPEATATYHPLALAYRESGDLAQAKAALAKAGSERVSFSDPLVRSLAQLARGARVHQLLGDRARARGLLEVAIELYRKSLLIDPENGLVHYNLGTVLAQLGADGEALDHFSAAVRWDPQLKNAHFNLALGLREQGDLPGAVEHLNQALTIDPGDDEARLELALTLAQGGQEQRAQDQLKALAERRPQDLRVALELATSFGRSGQFAAAAEHFQRVLAMDRENEAAHQGLAVALILSSQPAAAVEALHTGLETLPHSMELADVLARLLATCPDPTVRDSTRALEIADALFQAARRPRFGETVAMALAASGRFSEAIPWQERLLQEATQASLPDPFLRRLRANLARYQAGQLALPPF